MSNPLAKSPASSGPPSYKPVPKSPFAKAFAADPFDKRHTNADRTLTPLGVLIQQYHYLRCYLNEQAPASIQTIDAASPTPCPGAG